MDYVPVTDRDREEMLRAIGVGSIDELFADIPESVRFTGSLKLPAALSEPELVEHMRRLAEANADLDHYVGFLGAGAYEHYIPAIVHHVLARSEFYTAYTPYQAEISQGVLQAIYEYQSLICALTGMDVSNASMYDGPTAVAEAAIMACGATRRNKVLVPKTMHPEYRRVVGTYLASRDLKLEEIGYGEDGRLDIRSLENSLDGDVAGVILQHPNFFGILEDTYTVGDMVHKAGALYIATVNPISLGVLSPPSEYGADIVVGEGQPLGNSLSFGGPYLGFLAAREQLVRRMPGRIIGATVDHDGNRGYVLTLQTREQHIRRERATSNICSNEALNALAATVYLTAVGKQGIRDVAELCIKKAHYARDRITEIEGFDAVFSGPFFHEFVIRTSADPSELTGRLLDHQIIGGLPLGRFYPELSDSILFCVTETKSKEDIDRLAEVLEGLA